MTTTISFIPGRTSRSRNLLHDGYRYFLDKKRSEKSYWKCVNKTCSGRLSFVDDSTVARDSQLWNGALVRDERLRESPYQRCEDDLALYHQERMLLPPQTSPLEEAAEPRPSPGVPRGELSCPEVLSDDGCYCLCGTQRRLTFGTSGCRLQLKPTLPSEMEFLVELPCVLSYSTFTAFIEC